MSRWIKFLFITGRFSLLFGNIFIYDKRQRYHFNKSQRLLSADCFKTVFDNPSFKVHQTNILFFVKMKEPLSVETGVSNSQLYCRLGLAITKKKIKHANQRNRLKRLIREHFRLYQHDFNYVYDVVVIVKVGTESLTNEELSIQINTGFKQIIHKLNQFSKKNFAHSH